MKNSFKLSMLTPKKTFFQGEAVLVNLNIANGRIGMMYDMSPLTSYIKISDFSFVTSNNHKVEGVIQGGVVYMDGKECTIVSPRIKFKDDLDKKYANERLAFWKESLVKNEKEDQKDIINEKIAFYEEVLKIL